MKKTGIKIFLFLLFLCPAGWAFAQNDHYPQFMEMGNRAYDAEKYDLAIDYYQSAIDDNPDCWQAYVGLGNCYYYKKKLPESLKAYQKALKINPDNSELTRFIQFLKSKMGTTAYPTPTPTVVPTPVPGLPPLPPAGLPPLPPK
jgi:tetratricopeptide (TPR) repeat protein